jgi:hypothetical protein
MDTSYTTGGNVDEDTDVRIWEQCGGGDFTAAICVRSATMFDILTC